MRKNKNRLIILVVLVLFVQSIFATCQSTAFSESEALTPIKWENLLLEIDKGKYKQLNSNYENSEYVLGKYGSVLKLDGNNDFKTFKTNTTNEILDISYCNSSDRLIAVGKSGTIIINDGNLSDFSSISTDETRSINAVAFGNGITVIGGDQGLFKYSPDCTNWNNINIDPSYSITNISYAGGVFLALRHTDTKPEEQQILISINAINWDVLSDFEEFNYQVNKIKSCDDNHMILCSKGKVLMYSPRKTADKWSQLTVEADDEITDCFDDQRNQKIYFLSAKGNISVFDKSSEFVSTLVKEGNLVNNIVTSDRYDTLFVNAFDGSFKVFNFSDSNGILYRNTNYNEFSIFKYKQNQSKYFMSETTYKDYLYAVDYSYIYRSLDGIKWDTVFRTNLDMRRIKVVNNIIFVVCDDGDVIYSIDGNYWTTVRNGFSFPHLYMFFDIAYNGSRYIISGDDYIICSNDLKTWKLQALPGARHFSIEAVGGMFYMADPSGIWISTNGDNWTKEVSGNFRDILWTGSALIAVGNNNFDYYPISAVSYPLDSKDWNIGTFTGENMGFEGIVFNGIEYIGVANDYNYSYILRSKDGIHWVESYKTRDIFQDIGACKKFCVN